MLIQNRLSKKYCLATIKNDYIEVLYEDGSKTYCLKSKFQENFRGVEKDNNKIIIYIVNGAYFNDKSHANWQINFLKEKGFSVKQSFMYDTVDNIIERISKNDNDIQNKSS